MTPADKESIRAFCLACDGEDMRWSEERTVEAVAALVDKHNGELSIDAPLRAACDWATAHAYVLAHKTTIRAFAKAARVEVEFADGGVVVIGAEKEVAK